MFFPSNICSKAPYTSFGVLNEDTWGIRWPLIEYEMILLALASSPFGFGTSHVMYWFKSFSSRIREILYFHAQNLLAPPSLSLSWVWWVIFSNENLKWKYQRFRSYRFEVFDLVPELVDLGFVRETLISQTWSLGILFERKMCLLEVSCLAVSFPKDWGGKPSILDALVPRNTSDRVKNETSSIQKLSPPKDAPYWGELA